MRKVVVHEIKLQPAVIVMLGALVLCLFLKILPGVFLVQDAEAFNRHAASDMIMIRIVDEYGEDRSIQ